MCQEGRCGQPQERRAERSALGKCRRGETKNNQLFIENERGCGADTVVSRKVYGARAGMRRQIGDRRPVRVESSTTETDVEVATPIEKCE